ncbi:hypothetical protein KY284_025644 [Solanum tuberosum]|nr:hypothetical protein KY284_025644 [Solanum tuberosum]
MAHKVWQDLKDHFSQKNALAIYQIQKSLASLSQGNMNISSYFTKLKGLWDAGNTETYDVGINKSFSIAAVVQKRTNSFFNKSKDKHCEHCNREGHTIENCRTLKFHYKHCNRKGHTEDRCKFINGTWSLNNSGNQNNRQQRGSKGNPSHVANVIYTHQSKNEIHSQDTNGSHGFSTEQLRQIAQADLATGKMIGSGKHHDGLYYTSSIQKPPISHQVSQPKDLWHMRLGTITFSP